MTKKPFLSFFLFGCKMEMFSKVLLFLARCGSIITVDNAVLSHDYQSYYPFADNINKRMLFEERMS